MTLIGLCKECFESVPLDESTHIADSVALYECPECGYPNDWYDFNGIYEPSPLCACGHDVSEHGRDFCLACKHCVGMAWDNIQ